MSLFPQIVHSSRNLEFMWCGVQCSKKKAPSLCVRLLRGWTKKAFSIQPIGYYSAFRISSESGEMPILWWRVGRKWLLRRILYKKQLISEWQSRTTKTASCGAGVLSYDNPMIPTYAQCAFVRLPGPGGPVGRWDVVRRGQGFAYRWKGGKWESEKWKWDEKDGGKWLQPPLMISRRICVSTLQFRSDWERTFDPHLNWRIKS